MTQLTPTLPVNIIKALTAPQTVLIFDTFDVAAYGFSVQGPMRDELRGLDAELSAAAKHDLELLGRHLQATQGWMAHVLVTQTHKDARATAFLSSWAYEQHWVGDALLALAKVPVNHSYAHPHRPGDRLRALSPLAASIMANVHGGALQSVQMAERLVDNLVSDLLLEQVQKTLPQAAGDDLSDIRAILARQSEFFYGEAQRLLASSGAARRLTRRKLVTRTWPLGMSKPLRRQVRALLGKAELQAVTSRVRELPGLERVKLSVR